MNWDNAYKWAEAANDGKDGDFAEPNWSWDCGLKLDFDGGLVRVSSRFYQVSENTFDGSVSFLIGDDDIYSREFSSRHIDVLKKDVEEYVTKTTALIKDGLRRNAAVFIGEAF